METGKLYLKSLFKWAVLSAVVGIICGLIGSAFHIGVEYATGLRMSNPWLLFLLPLAGVLIAGIYKVFNLEGQTTNSIIEEVQSGRGLKPLLIPSIFISTVLTHLCGGSAGREGAALQMGGTIGFEVGQLMKFDDRDLRTATMAGMAAFFSALFGTPLAAAVFAIGVISVGLIYHAALLPCFLSALVAYGVSVFLGVEPTKFTVEAPSLDPLMLIKVAFLGALAAGVSILFCKTIHFAEKFGEKYIPNPFIKPIVGGALIIGLSLVLGTGDYNGAGMDVITRAVEEGISSSPAFLLKILFTAITLAAGFKGGEVVPSFFVGATFGCFAGSLIGIPTGFSAALGLIAVFCGAVNCPLASIFLSVELFGGEGLIYFALVCTLSYVLSGYSGLYSSQRILYSKIKAQYINVTTNAHQEGESTEAMREHP